MVQLWMPHFFTHQPRASEYLLCSINALVGLYIKDIHSLEGKLFTISLSQSLQDQQALKI